MSTFHERLVAEKDELDSRMDKLATFIASEQFRTTHVGQQALLHVQINAMATYSQVLEQRLLMLGPL